MSPATFDPVVSVVDNATATKTADATLSAIAQRIRGPELAGCTELTRRAYATGGKAAADPIKKRLPGALFAGCFNRRASDAMLTAAGLLVADLDNLTPEQLIILLLALAADPAVVLLFISPSGTGLKVVVRTGVTDCSEASHLRAFQAVARWMREVYGAELDPSGKDRARLCFLCHDPEAYYNPAAVPLDLDQWAEPVAVPPPRVAAVRAVPEHEAERRARAYIDRLPQSIEHQGGHPALFRAACALVHGFDLPEPVALGLLRVYNLRGDPETEAQLRHKIAQAASHPHREPRGYLLNADRKQTENSPDGRAASAPWPALPPLGNAATPPPFDPDSMLPGELAWFAAWCRTTAETIGVDPCWPAILGLATASLSVAGAVEIEPWPGYREKGPLWVLGLALPSERKSPVFTIATLPIREWEAAEAKRLRIPLAQHRTRRSALERRLDTIKTRMAKSDGDEAMGLRGELDSAAAELADWPDLMAPCLTVTDSTPEAVADIMHRNGGMAGVVDDEGAAIAAWLGRYADDGARVELANKGYSGTPAMIVRKGRDALHIPHPLLACVLAVQPAVLGTILNANAAVARGFLARFLVFRPPSRAGYDSWAPPPIPEELAARYNGTIEKLLSMPRPGRIVEGMSRLTCNGGEPAVVRLSTEAEAIAKDLYEALAIRLRVDGDLNDPNGWGGKLRGNLFRLAMAMHALAGGGPEVSGGVMRAAAAWAPLVVAHFRSAIEEAKEPPELHHARRLWRKLQRRGQASMTARDMFRLVEDSAVPSMDEFRPVLALLVEHGAIRPSSDAGATTGRPAERYEIHPDLLPPRVLSVMSDNFSGTAAS